MTTTVTPMTTLIRTKLQEQGEYPPSHIQVQRVLDILKTVPMFTPITTDIRDGEVYMGRTCASWQDAVRSIIEDVADIAIDSTLKHLHNLLRDSGPYPKGIHTVIENDGQECRWSIHCTTAVQ